MVGEGGKAGGSDERAKYFHISKVCVCVCVSGSLSVCACVSFYLVAVVLACTAELQKSVRTSGSLRAAMHAAKGI